MAPEVAACDRIKGDERGSASAGDGRAATAGVKAEAYGLSVDSWSFGVLICEMLTGEPPLPETIDWRREGDKIVEFLKEIKCCGDGQWPRCDVIRLLGDAFPEAAETVLTMMEVKPGKRPSFAGDETVDALPWFKGHGGVSSIHAGQQQPPNHSRKFVCEFADGYRQGEDKLGGLTAEQQALFDF